MCYRNTVAILIYIVTLVGAILGLVAIGGKLQTSSPDKASWDLEMAVGFSITGLGVISLMILQCYRRKRRSATQVTDQHDNGEFPEVIAV